MRTKIIPLLALCLLLAAFVLVTRSVEAASLHAQHSHDLPLEGALQGVQGALGGLLGGLGGVGGGGGQ